MDATIRFRSKIGATFMMMTVVFVALVGEAIVTSVRAHAIVMPAILGLALVFWIWIAVDTRYFVTPTTLFVRSGPVRRTIPLASIRRLKASRTAWASPALSLDRIEVSYREGDSVLISPRDKAGFVRAIGARVAGVAVEGLPDAV